MCITIISIAALPFAYSLIFATHLHRQVALLTNIFNMAQNRAEGGGIEPPLPRIKRSCALPIKLTP